MGFGCILFCMHRDRVEILCLDLLVTNKWYLSDKFINSYMFHLQAIVTKNNNVHFIGLDLEDHAESISTHLVFSLYDIIPNELIEIYTEYYTLLVNGYVRKYINICDKDIPHSLKRLIACFYPCFV